MSQGQAKKSSRKARNKAARLYAVQAVYQMRANEQAADLVIQDFKDVRLHEKIDGQEMVFPDGLLLANIVQGVEARLGDVEPVMRTITGSRSGSNADNAGVLADALLWAILLCGGYELMAHQDLDGPVIINDYVDVAHAFFDGRESKLVNGALDAAYKAFRDGV